MKLQGCLLKDRYLINSNYEELGKSQGSLFFRHKFVLAYSSDKGWKIRKLNVFQLFLRKVFKAYKSTHLDHIKNKMKKLEITDLTKACHERIHRLWVTKNCVGLGNANRKDASIICLGETHTDLEYIKAVSTLSM